MTGDETDDYAEQVHATVDDLLQEWQQSCRDIAEEEGLPGLDEPLRSQNFPPWAIAQMAVIAVDVRRLERSMGDLAKTNTDILEIIDRLIRKTNG